MIAPDECKPPQRGKLKAWCCTNFCGGAWLVVDSQRRIITQYSDPFYAARHVNRHNLEEL